MRPVVSSDASQCRTGHSELSSLELAGDPVPSATPREQARISPPIFVGGTGRCGTTILGRLLGKQRDYTVIPVEARFHCSPDGLPGVLAGAVTPEDFARRVIDKWWSAKLAELVERDALELALARFLELAHEDPVAAGRGLMEELFGGYARLRGRGGWVEMTPINAMWGAPHLNRLFPESRFVNVIRDGRDVASSLIAVGWLGAVGEALGWWEDRMLKGHERCRSLPPGALLTVRFERLLVDDREGALEELRSFMGWEEDASMRRFFTRRMPPEEAHVGRWKMHFTGRERRLVEAEYAAILERLRTAGVSTP
jgi:Sulfotransferase family